VLPRGFPGCQGALYVVVEEAEKQGVEVNIDYVVDQMIMLLFAGTETTATSLISACLLLDGRQDVMSRLREELQV
jgi:cytochrome P450